MTKVPCESCCGSGARPLHPYEDETLRAVGPSWSLTGQIASRLDHACKIPALNNRLRHLEGLGLVEVRPINGKIYEWRSKPRWRATHPETITTARKAG